MRIILEGGWPMYPILALGVLCLLLAVRHAAVPQRSLVPLIVGSAVAAVLFGFFGTTVGLMHAIEGTRDLPPDERYLWVIGLKEALSCAGSALALVLLATPLATVGSWRLAKRAEAIVARS
jgi:hypothetical protein